jgi:hypothetical protein
MPAIPTASAQDLMYQATSTVDSYVRAALQTAEEQEIEATPEYVASFIKAAAIDYATAAIIKGLDAIVNNLFDRLQED